jgi:hypothetical protein
MSETVKIEYAPDYKSSKFSHYFNEQMKDPEFAAAYRKVSAEEDNGLKKALEREWKLNELKNAVVEAAKVYRCAEISLWDCEIAEDAEAQRNFEGALSIMDDAIDALLQFEQEQSAEKN